ncbi:MAG: hypothetical protein J7J87_04330 [Candidatus Diapherotrites archaeon]|nr:hypothetical protein [Candidatus Diapherotrites archaeon]
MFKKFLVLIAYLILVQFCFAQQLMPVIMVSIKANEGKITISDVRVVVDHLSEPEEAGRHVIKLKDDKNKTLYQLKVYMHGVGFPPYGAEMSKEELEEFYKSLEENFEKTVYLPYLKKAIYITLEDSNGEVARFDLSKLCNNNGACEENENYLSCASDCPLSEKDDYCLPLKDSICDPDCSKGLDSDCGAKKNIPLFITSNYLFLAIALIIVVIAAYRITLLRKKK